MPQAQPPLDDRGLPAGYALDTEREITPREVAAKLEAGRHSGEDVLLVDCRQPAEWDITHIDGAVPVPLQQLPELFDEHLAGHEQREVIVYCRSGRRSLEFVSSLRRAGFPNARSMAGGVLLWNRDVRPGGPQY